MLLLSTILKRESKAHPKMSKRTMERGQRTMANLLEITLGTDPSPKTDLIPEGIGADPDLGIGPGTNPETSPNPRIRTIDLAVEIEIEISPTKVAIVTVVKTEIEITGNGMTEMSLDPDPEIGTAPNLGADPNLVTSPAETVPNLGTGLRTKDRAAGPPTTWRKA